VIAGQEQKMPFVALEAEDLEKLRMYITELPKKEMYPETFLYRDGRMLTISASTITNSKTEIFLRADTDPETVLDTIAAVLRTPEFFAHYEEGKKLISIDLRVLNKVAYRFE
jgi:uncharacterized protein (DUF4213/DUF364 family)